jgi:hypothetical protein
MATLAQSRPHIEWWGWNGSLNGINKVYSRLQKWLLLKRERTLGTSKPTAINESFILNLAQWQLRVTLGQL